MRLDWAGCLSDLREQYTSVELQKQANVWREEMALGYLQQNEYEESTEDPTVEPSYTRGLRFDWCAGPDDLPIGKTSVELQHEALELTFQMAEKNSSNR